MLKLLSLISSTESKANMKNPVQILIAKKTTELDLKKKYIQHIRVLRKGEVKKQFQYFFWFQVTLLPLFSGVWFSYFLGSLFKFLSWVFFFFFILAGVQTTFCVCFAFAIWFHKPLLRVLLNVCRSVSRNVLSNVH